MNPVLELRSLSKSFFLPSGEPLHILDGLDLVVAPGEVVAIVGRSGSGKSTLLNILGLLDKPSAGAFLCDGVDVTAIGDAKTAELRGSFLGFVFQQFHLLDGRSAIANVAEPLLYAPASERRGRKARAAKLLADVGLADRAGSMPNLLSGGEQQRVALARALVRRPRVVLADEPTGALDAVTAEHVLGLLLELVRAEGVSMVLVTHDERVASRADRVLELVDGRLEAADG